MDVTLWHFDDCASWRLAEQRLRAVLDRLGRPDAVVTRRRMVSAAHAEAMGLRGSPTILVDGHDPFADTDAPTGLACRLYPTPEGLAGAPTVEQLYEVMAARMSDRP